MRYLHALLSIIILQTLLSCTPIPSDVTKSEALPAIYPDYMDVTIPVNIAPLNFLVRDNIEAIQVTAGTMTINAKGNEVVFDEDEWHELLKTNEDIKVTITTLKNGKWTEYRSFHWLVVKDKVDPYLTYRLIEPDYEIWNNLQIKQRCVENFNEKALCDYHLANNQCMNCHVTGGQDPNLSMMYVRGPHGGAILNQNGKLRKLAIKTSDMISGSVYYGFSPTGRYITFSTNIIIPAFHSNASKRLEVYDAKSDVYVADLQENRIIRSPLLSDSLTFETFPTFSPNGKYIYYCTAKHVTLPQELKQLQYALVRIPFDEKTGAIGSKVDTLFNQKSVCHPRISPDGRYLVYTVADYGTFPIWHQESDLRMMDLQTGQIDTMKKVNSSRSDTYHSWSSNSRWLVFASKRDNSLYGKPYFCYIDHNGKPHKPFVLPQESPTYYDETLKSFNAPEFSKGDLPFNAVDVESLLRQEAEPFH